MQVTLLTVCMINTLCLIYLPYIYIEEYFQGRTIHADAAYKLYPYCSGWMRLAVATEDGVPEMWANT